MSNGCYRKRRKGRKTSQQPAPKEDKDATKPFDTVIEVGAEFDSFDCLDMAIKAYEAENFVNLIMRDTRRIEVAAKRNRRKIYNPAIRYSDLCYCCTYGGKKFKSRSVGKRVHKTIKQACPFNLKVRATLDGQRLFVREMCAVHSHEITEADFRMHPKQRKLNHASQEEVATLLCLKPDKKLLREKLMQVTGKVILMKDIHNIKTRLLSSKAKALVHGEIDDNFTSVTTTQEEEEGGEKEDENSQSTAASVVSFVDDLTTDASEHSVCHDLVVVTSGRRHETSSTDSLSIHIPISQINPADLSSVLNTIVEGTATSDEMMELPPETQNHPVAHSRSCHQQQQPQGSPSQQTVGPLPGVDAIMASPGGASSSSEFPHPSSSIFPCPLDDPSPSSSFHIFSSPRRQQPHDIVYHHHHQQISPHQPLLSVAEDVVAASIVVDPPPSPLTSTAMNNSGSLNHKHASATGGATDSCDSERQTSYGGSPLEEVGSALDLNALQGLQPWAVLDSSPSPSPSHSHPHPQDPTTKTQFHRPHISDHRTPQPPPRLSHSLPEKGCMVIITPPHAPERLSHVGGNDASQLSSRSISPSARHRIVLSSSNSKTLLAAGKLDHPQDFQSYHQQQQQQQQQHHHQQQQQQQQYQQKTVRQRKRIVSGASSSSSTSSSISSRKTRRNPIDLDKDALKKKYFQQASANLFFNERLLSLNGKEQAKDSLLTTQGTQKMSGSTSGNYHKLLKPLSWLFGTWRGQQGKGIYPTLQDFAYVETAHFQPIPTKPVIEYKFCASSPDGSTPMHKETGFIRINPESNQIAFVASHNLGIAEIQEGEVKDGELTVETTQLARVPFNKPPAVKKVRRSLKRTGDTLEHVMLMETENTPMTEHLRISFKRVES